MKTLILATSMFGNAVSDYYYSLGTIFTKNNYKVIFIFDGKPENFPEKKENFIYYSWPSKRPTKLKDFLFFYRLLNRYRPEICISNFGSTNIVSIAAFLLKVKNRINYVHTTSMQIDLDSNNLFRTKLLRLRKKNIYKLNTALFTNSEGNKLDVVKNFGFPMEKIQVYPLLINESEITYKSQLYRDQCMVIVGRLDFSKGHEALLKQFSTCLLSFPDLKLKVVGSGPLLYKLKELVEQLRIDKNVEFLGRLTRSEIDSIFSSSLISISSSYEEAFGLVNIEALRVGTPLLCTKTSGSTDILEENINGLFFDINTNDSLLNSLEKVLLNWEKFSIGSLNSFNLKYNEKIVIEDHFNKIEEFIDGNSKK